MQTERLFLMWLAGAAKGSIDVLPPLARLEAHAANSEPLPHEIVWPDKTRTPATCIVRGTAAGFELDYADPKVRQHNIDQENDIGSVVLSRMPNQRFIVHWRPERSDEYEQSNAIVLFESEASTFKDALRPAK